MSLMPEYGFNAATDTSAMKTMKWEAQIVSLSFDTLTVKSEQSQ